MTRSRQQQLKELLQERICGVCPDRNADGSCERLNEGSCMIMKRVGAVAGAVILVESDRMAPYIDSIRQHVCSHCELVNPDGSCDWRRSGRCTLDSYLPIIVDCVEEFFGKSVR